LSSPSRSLFRCDARPVGIGVAIRGFFDRVVDLPVSREQRDTTEVREAMMAVHGRVRDTLRSLERLVSNELAGL
jgi:hypothetical protein